MGIVAVLEKGHCRSRNEHEGKIWKYSEEPGRDETGPTRRFLQRPADQETAETKEDFDGELAKVLAVARNRRLRTSRQVKMMAEQNGGRGTETDEVRNCSRGVNAPAGNPGPYIFAV